MRLLSACLSFLPLPALALSCMPYAVTDAYLQAAAAEEGYVPVVGTLDFDAELLPVVDWGNQQDVPPVTLIPATFKGEALSISGVSQSFATDVVLEVRCSGPWCPNPQPGRMLGFLRRTLHSYVLTIGACRGFLFDKPDDGMVDALNDCLRGRSCLPEADR